MLRALFSTRYLQQLLREGKLANEGIYFYAILLHHFAVSCLILAFLNLFTPQLLEKSLLQPVPLFGLIFGTTVIVQLASQLFLWYFSSIFNYQEQKYLYTTIKTLYRFCNGLLLIIMVSITWYAHIPELIIFVYFPLFIIIFISFFILFLRNISGVSRIHFFIYFCTLEILPYLLAAKLLIINL